MTTVALGSAQDTLKMAKLCRAAELPQKPVAASATPRSIQLLLGNANPQPTSRSLAEWIGMLCHEHAGSAGQALWHLLRDWSARRCLPEWDEALALYTDAAVPAAPGGLPSLESLTHILLPLAQTCGLCTSQPFCRALEEHLPMFSAAAARMLATARLLHHATAPDLIARLAHTLGLAPAVLASLFFDEDNSPLPTSASAAPVESFADAFCALHADLEGHPALDQLRAPALLVFAENLKLTLTAPAGICAVALLLAAGTLRVLDHPKVRRVLLAALRGPYEALAVCLPGLSSRDSPPLDARCAMLAACLLGCLRDRDQTCTMLPQLVSPTKVARHQLPDFVALRGTATLPDWLRAPFAAALLQSLAAPLRLRTARASPEPSFLQLCNAPDWLDVLEDFYGARSQLAPALNPADLEPFTAATQQLLASLVRDLSTNIRTLDLSSITWPTSSPRAERALLLLRQQLASDTEAQQREVACLLSRALSHVQTITDAVEPLRWLRNELLDNTVPFTADNLLNHLLELVSAPTTTETRQWLAGLSQSPRLLEDLLTLPQPATAFARVRQLCAAASLLPVSLSRALCGPLKRHTLGLVLVRRALAAVSCSSPQQALTQALQDNAQRVLDALANQLVGAPDIDLYAAGDVDHLCQAPFEARIPVNTERDKLDRFGALELNVHRHVFALLLGMAACLDLIQNDYARFLDRRLVDLLCSESVRNLAKAWLGHDGRGAVTNVSEAANERSTLPVHPDVWWEAASGALRRSRIDSGLLPQCPLMDEAAQVASSLPEFNLEHARVVLEVLANEPLMTAQLGWCLNRIMPERFRSLFMLAAGQGGVTKQTEALAMTHTVYKLASAAFQPERRVFDLPLLCQQLTHHPALVTKRSTVAAVTNTRLVELESALAGKGQIGELARRQVHAVLTMLTPPSGQRARAAVVHVKCAAGHQALQCRWELHDDHASPQASFTDEEVDDRFGKLRDTGSEYGLAVGEADAAFRHLQLLADVTQDLIDSHAFGCVSERTLFARPLHPLPTITELRDRLASYRTIWRAVVANVFDAFASDPCRPPDFPGHHHLLRLGLPRVAEIERIVAPPLGDADPPDLSVFCDGQRVQRPRAHADVKLDVLDLVANGELHRDADRLHGILQAKFAFVAQILDRNCQMNGPALPAPVSDAVVTGGVDANVLVLTVTDLPATLLGTTHTFAVLATAVGAVQSLCSQPEARCEWPSRHLLYTCTPAEEFAIDSLRGFLRGFTAMAAPETAGPPHTAYLLLPDQLGPRDQAAVGTVLSEFAPALRRDGWQLIVVLAVFEDRLQERLALVLRAQLQPARIKIPSPSTQELAGFAHQLARVRRMLVAVVSGTADGRQARCGKSYSIQRWLGQQTASPSTSVDPLLLADDGENLDTLLLQMSRRPAEHIWLEVAGAPKRGPSATPLADAAFWQLLCFGGVRLPDASRAWFLLGRTTFLVEVHLPEDSADGVHLPFLQLLASAKGAPALPVGEPPGLDLAALPHVLPKAACPDCRWGTEGCLAALGSGLLPLLQPRADLTLDAQQRIARLAHWLSHAGPLPAVPDDLWSSARAWLGTPYGQQPSAFWRQWLLNAGPADDAWPAAWQSVKCIYLPCLAAALQGGPPEARLLALRPCVGSTVSASATPTALPVLEQLLVAWESLREFTGAEQHTLLRTLGSTMELMFGAGAVQCVLDQHSGFVVSPLVMVRLLLLGAHFCLNLPLVLEGETGVGKTKLLQVFADLVRHAHKSAGVPAGTAPVELRILDMNPAHTVGTVTEWLDAAVQAAQYGAETGIMGHCGSIPTCILFVDEINCASPGVLSLVASVMLDRRALLQRGPQRLPCSVWVVAACNPCSRSAGHSAVLYNVLPLPARLQAMRLSLDAMDDADVRLIIAARLAAWPHLVACTSGTMLLEAAQLVHQSHCAAQASARELWTKNTSAPAVSLRDVDRALALADTLLDDRLGFLHSPGRGTQPTLVALSVGAAMAYCLRLTRSQRQRVTDHAPTLLTPLRELADMADRLEHVLGVDHAQGVLTTAGLRETMLALFVHALARIPLFLVGPAGTSKSFALTVFVQAMRDMALRQQRPQLQGLPVVNAAILQCSPALTAAALQGEFERARVFADNVDATQELAMVVLEEMGLAYTTDMVPSLKVLHGLLDGQLVLERDRRLAFVALSNTFLDVAKMNRGTVLVREALDTDDLCTMAQQALSRASVWDDAAKASVAQAVVALFRELVTHPEHLRLPPTGPHVAAPGCVPWAAYMPYFGSRDFFAFLQVVSSQLHTSGGEADGAGPAQVYRVMLDALLAQFAGIPGMLEVLSGRLAGAIGQYVAPVDEDVWLPQSRARWESSLAILQGQLQAAAPHHLSVNVPSGGEGGWTLQERHVLCISSLPPLRFWLHLLQALEQGSLMQAKNPPRMVFGAGRPVHAVVEDVALAMRTGGCVALAAGVPVLNCLLDVINGHALQAHGPATTRQVRVAIGARSKFVPVDERFRLVIVAGVGEVDLFPVPILHRLRKVALAPATLLADSLRLLVQRFPGGAAVEQPILWELGLVRHVVDLETWQLVIVWETMLAVDLVQDGRSWHSVMNDVLHHHKDLSELAPSFSHALERACQRRDHPVTGAPCMHLVWVLQQPQPLLREQLAQLADIIVFCERLHALPEEVAAKRRSSLALVVPAEAIAVGVLHDEPGLMVWLGKLRERLDFCSEDEDEDDRPPHWLVLTVDGAAGGDGDGDAGVRFVSRLMDAMWSLPWRTPVMLLFQRPLDIDFGGTEKIAPSPQWVVQLAPPPPPRPLPTATGDVAGTRTGGSLPPAQQQLLEQHLRPRLSELEVVQALAALASWSPVQRELVLPEMALSRRLVALLQATFHEPGMHAVGHSLCISATSLERRSDAAELGPTAAVGGVTTAAVKMSKSTALPTDLVALALQWLHTCLGQQQQQHIKIVPEVRDGGRGVVVVRADPACPMDVWSHALRLVSSLQECHCKWQVDARVLAVLQDARCFQRIKKPEYVGNNLQELCRMQFSCEVVPGPRWWRVSAVCKQQLQACHDCLREMQRQAQPCERRQPLLEVMATAVSFREIQKLFPQTDGLVHWLVTKFKGTRPSDLEHSWLDADTRELCVSAPQYAADAELVRAAAHLHHLLGTLELDAVFFTPRVSTLLAREISQLPCFNVADVVLGRVLDGLVDLPDVVLVDEQLDTQTVAVARGAAALHARRVAAVQGRATAAAQHAAQLQQDDTVLIEQLQRRYKLKLAADGAGLTEQDVLWTVAGQQRAHFRVSAVAQKASRRGVLLLFGAREGIRSCRQRVQDAESEATQATCSTCWGDLDARYSVHCDNEQDPHFFCSECFQNLVGAACDLDGQLIGRDSDEVQVLCTACTLVFPLQLIAEKSPPETMAKLTEANDKLREARLRRELDEEYDAKLQRELDRLQSLSAQERDAHLRFLWVTDNIMTLRCPRCRQPFDEHDACTAVQCSRCPCGFCSLCLEDCGADAHGHRATCPLLRATYPPGTRPFVEVHRRRRELELRQYFEREVKDRAVFNHLVDLLEAPARQLGIQLPPKHAHVAQAREEEIVGEAITRTPDREIGGGVRMYMLQHAGASADQSAEHRHFAVAFAQFNAMQPGAQRSVPRVEHWVSPAVVARFMAKRAEFGRAGKSTETKWVFHGTASLENVVSIVSGGFKVGGQGGHAIANGATYGQGVYTATGPGAPMGYSRGNPFVILCKALVGNTGAAHTGNSDSWSPTSDWLIFRSADQLLPLYVIHFS